MIKYNKKLMYTSFFIYIVLLIWIIIFKWTNYQAAQESIITFRKFNISERYIACKPSFWGFDIVDIVLNLLLFLPLGLYFTLLLKRKHLILLIGLLLTISFEISQFFTCIGMYNSFDIIGNVLGCVLGYVLFLFLRRFFKQKVIDTTNIIITVLLTPVCFYAIIITIVNFNYYL